MEAQALTHPSPEVPHYLSYIFPIRVAARIQWDHTSRNAARAVRHCLSVSLILWHNLPKTMPWSRNQEETPYCHQSRLKNERNALWLVNHLWSSALFWSCPPKIQWFKELGWQNIHISRWRCRSTNPKGNYSHTPNSCSSDKEYQDPSSLAEATSCLYIYTGKQSGMQVAFTLLLQLAWQGKRDRDQNTHVVQI